VARLLYWRIFLLDSIEDEMSDSMLWNEIGKIYQKMGLPVDAIAAYSHAIELDPTSGWPYCNLGHAYFLAGEFGNALFLFRKSIQLMDTRENQALVWNQIGDTYRALKDIDNAIQAYKKADNLDMGAPQLENRQTDINGNPRDAIRSVKAIPESNNHPDNSSGLNPKGENHTNGKSLQPVTGGDGNRVDNHRTEGREAPVPSLLKPTRAPGPEISMPSHDIQPKEASLPGRVEPLHEQLKETSAIMPNSNNGSQPPAKTEPIQFIPGQNRLSEKAVRQIEIRTENSHDPSKTCLSIENLEEILAKVNIYENITRVNPTSDRAWDTLGKLYKSLGRYKDAISAYQKAVELTPEKEVYHYYLGLLYAVEQQHDDAVRAFLFVLHKNPDYVLAHSALAGIYHRMGLENKANHHIAIALPKMNGESAYNRACFYAICGDTELAIEFLSLALTNKDTTIEWIKTDPDLDTIRTDQRFQELVYEKDSTTPESSNGNFYSSELEGMHNRLLPILNNSLAR
jgi:tetratricopeptide (TPR) repeat protein